MGHLRRFPCTELNEQMKRKVLIMHDVFRKHFPKQLKLHFGINEEAMVEAKDEFCNLLDDSGGLQDDGLNLLFSGDGIAALLNDSPKLQLLKELALEIAKKSMTEKDSKDEQVARNLVFIIGQKAAEMHLVNVLVGKSVNDLETYFDTAFILNNGVIELDEVDIREGAWLVEVSRNVFKCLVEAEDFENNFCKHRSRMPRTYFKSCNGTLTMDDKADIFTVHYICNSNGQAKNITQNLGRNSSFKSFGRALPAVLERLKRRKFVETVEEGERDNAGRLKKRFKLTYNSEELNHQQFLVKFQVIYPGETF